MTEPTILDMALRLTAAVIFAWALGWERKRSNKRVGARTLIITAIGAAGFVMLGLVLSSQAHAQGVAADPTRVLSYLVVGVGFLGGGVIVQHRNRVRGMTTAATFWATAAIGAACGLGEFPLATMLAVICFVALEIPGREAPSASDGENGTAADRDRQRGIDEPSP